jgi:hypothetical protein
MKGENLKKAFQLEEAESSVAYITNIILNPKKYNPRKLSTGEEHKLSKYDAFDPFLYNSNKGRKSNLHNKFDFEENKPFQGRKKAYSINYNFTPKNKLPLNKNYEPINPDFVYSLKDITRIQLNMILLKKFELPKEFDEGFIEAIMMKEPRKTLDHFKPKEKGFRERSNTMNNISYYRNVKI